MPRPASFRLREELLRRLNEEAAEREMSVTALVTMLLDEGLKTGRFPGIAYRDGPAGRRAGIVGGPDVWEVVAALKCTSGRGDQRVRRLAAELGLPEQHLRVAIDFYAAYPDEVDDRMDANEQAASRTRSLITRRKHLLSL